MVSPPSPTESVTSTNLPLSLRNSLYFWFASAFTNTPGQPLFSLDDRELMADLGVKRASLAAYQARLVKLQQAPRAEEVPPAEAKVAEAKAQLGDAEVQVRLIESVTDRRAVRQEDVERRRLNLQASQAHLDEAEKNLAVD